MTIEAPERCKSGEQIGVRVDIFNNQLFGMFVTVVLKGSEDYNFIHVEQDGFVESYKPRLASGEHQHQIWVLKLKSKRNDFVYIYLAVVFSE